MEPDQDVTVILSHDRVYDFHASTLSRNSIVFRDLLLEKNAAKLNSHAIRAKMKRWMVELVEMPCDKYPAGQLGLIHLDANGQRNDGRTGRILNENGRVPTKLFDHWERVLYAFYGSEIRIADDDMGAALIDCIGIIKVAEYLGCVTIIGKPVEVALLKHGQALFRAIQDRPYAWANMSFRIRSELIFREAMIHLAGNWNTWKKNRMCMEHLKMTPAAKQLAEKYSRRLIERSKALEAKLISHYPGDLATPKPDFPIKREEYAKDILIWIALSWFRHWFGQSLVSDKGHNADDGGYSLYKVLLQGGDAYMDKAILSQFHGLFPMTKKALNVAENHLQEIKECMTEWVVKSNLMKSTCQLNIEKYPVSYITCTEFENADFPWLKDDEQAATGRKGKRASGNDIARLNLEAAKRHQEINISSANDAVDEGEDEEEGPQHAPKRGRYE